MKDIRYEAAGPEGKVSRANALVHDLDDLYATLRGKGENLVRIVSIRDIREGGVALSGKELLELFEVLGSLTSSGLRIHEAVTIALDLPLGQRMGRVVHAIHEHIQRGTGFARAVGESVRKLPPLLGGMLEIGERTGKLGEVMAHSIEFLQTMKNLREKISSAAVYPLFIVGIMVVGIVLLLTVFVPYLRNEMAGGSSVSQGMTAGFDRLTVFLAILLVVLGIPLMSIVVYRFWKERLTAYARLVEGLFVRLPMVGRIATTSQLFSVSFTLEVLTGSGIPLQEALRLTGRTMSMIAFRQVFAGAADDVKEGASLSQALRNHRIIPMYFMRWIGIAERTGKPGQVFGQLRAYYQKQLNTHISRVTALIEPVLIATVGLLMILVIVMVVLPLFTMYTAGGR